MAAHPHTGEVRAFDTDLGDDGDAPGIAQELTLDDIDDIAWSPDMAVEDRLGRLYALRDELAARASADTMGDMRELQDAVRDRIRALKSNPVEGDAMLSSTGMDTTDRADDDDPADADMDSDEVS